MRILPALVSNSACGFAASAGVAADSVTRVANNMLMQLNMGNSLLRLNADALFRVRRAAISWAWVAPGPSPARAWEPPAWVHLQTAPQRRARAPARAWFARSCWSCRAPARDRIRYPPGANTHRQDFRGRWRSRDARRARFRVRSWPCRSGPSAPRLPLGCYAVQA